MKLLAALFPMLLTLVGRVLTALGVTALTYVGVDALVTRFQGEIQNLISGAPLAMLQIFYIAGGGVVLNILFGAMAFIVAFKQMTKVALLARKG